MAENGNDQINVPVPEDPLIRNILMDVQRSREDERTSAEWLVLFRKSGPDVYDGAFDPTRLEA